MKNGGLKVERKEGIVSILNNIKAKIIKTSASTSAQLTFLDGKIEIVFGRENIMKYGEMWIKKAHKEEIFIAFQTGKFPESFYNSLKKAFRNDCQLRLLCNLKGPGKSFVKRVNEMLKSIDMLPSDNPNSPFKYKNCVIRDTRVVGVGEKRLLLYSRFIL